MENQNFHLWYEEMGKGTPVIFLHGFPLDHSTWYPVVDILKDKARIILPDLRGHGNSKSELNHYSMRAMADDIANLMDDLNIKKAILVGHSLGGYISFAFAEAYPTRLCGLGLVATQAGADTLERRQGRYKTIENIKKHGLASHAKEMAQRLTSSPDVIEKVESLILSASPQTVIGTMAAIAERTDFTEKLFKILVPAVVISGKNDRTVPRERAEIMAQMLAHAWLVEIPESEHMPMLENPKETAEALGQLITLVENK